MLVVTNRRWPSISAGSATVSSTVCATFAASSPPPTWGSSRVNSSPPTRATVSVSRTASRSLPATFWSRRSPAPWPRVSLTRLN